eukprot:6195521-Pleurochrysis_carterae.AAC.6
MYHTRLCFLTYLRSISDIRQQRMQVVREVPKMVPVEVEVIREVRGARAMWHLLSVQDAAA